MVTDVYSHIMNDDRKRLARNMDNQFFRNSSEESEKAAEQPTMSEPMNQLIELLKNSPEIVEPLLQMSKALGTKKS